MTWRFEHYETLASTSDLCRERAEAGEKEKLAVMAERQSAARGSRGRGWDSGEGNLAFSFFFHFSDNQSFRAILPFLSALALYDGLVAAAGLSAEDRKALMLKWPNDLLLSGRKMAGILIETGFSPKEDSSRGAGARDDAFSARPGGCWAVIGMGVNLRQAPVIPGRCLAALAELVAPLGVAVPEAKECAAAILQAFDHWLGRWQAEGTDPVRDGWMERAHPLGTRLTLVRHGRETAGWFAGLDMQGHLLLSQDDGTVTSVVTGDILCE